MILATVYHCSYVQVDITTIFFPWILLFLCIIPFSPYLVWFFICFVISPTYRQIILPLGLGGTIELDIHIIKFQMKVNVSKKNL